jgi:hypothetical protein
LATCDEIKAKSGVSAAYLECVAKQNADNYLPWSGPAPGMTMDQMDNSIDKTLCEGEASFCDGHQPGRKGRQLCVQIALFDIAKYRDTQTIAFARRHNDS